MRRIAVRGIALYEGKLLCTKLKPYNSFVTEGAEWWCLPGGTVEEGEKIEDAIKREFFEETGISPVVGRLLYVQQFIHNEKEHLEFFFEIVNPLDFLSVDLSKTSHGAVEIEKIDFVDLESTVVLPRFLKEELKKSGVHREGQVRFFFSNT